jgi:hypothetical protein
MPAGSSASTSQAHLDTTVHAILAPPISHELHARTWPRCFASKSCCLGTARSELRPVGRILECLTLILHGNISKYVKMAGSSLKGFGQGVQGKVATQSSSACHPQGRGGCCRLRGIQVPGKPLGKAGKWLPPFFVFINGWLCTSSLVPRTVSGPPETTAHALMRLCCAHKRERCPPH